MLTEKAIAICLLEVLREYSDFNHILSMSEIIGKIRNIYGLTPDRRTVYSALDTLVELGYDISFYKENGKGYYLIDKLLEPSEAHLLSDAVCTFPFISERQTSELIKKIHSLLSVHERRQIKNLTVIRADQKTANKSVFYNIEILDEAIERKRKVTFDYYEYGTDKQLHKRREKKYKVNPYGMVYANEHYYLVCIMSRQQNVSMYRIDRIQNIEITDIALDENNIEPQSIVRNAVYAHTGEAVDVEMLIEPKVLSDVIDRFGTDLVLYETEDGRIKVRIKATAMGMKYWALQYLASVEVVEPKELRDEIMEMLRDNWYCKEG
ncbi:MAG: WYL domain-containing protein [Clostridia bacterium]|nr:WYL domain-containing protein [Clostridia bacterium]